MILLGGVSEKIFDGLMVTGIVSGILAGALSLYHHVSMDALARDMDKAYHQGAENPQSLTLDPKRDFLCTATVEVLAEHGYSVSINGFILKPETVEAKGICKVNSKVLRYWKPRGGVRQMPGDGVIENT
ncbi:hypothetical protein RBE51_17630 [Pseudomonas taiwanensis]|uniref:hypothetical protein n=1 Tax=Pseudomonas taiwanensis TaxID=470150 RepID=UPI0028DDFC7C|nr:hypothetical protein [Pseudomonas taiwanensis]MDT8924631.1 hypothetical protein [Pseudomonas taiwanensis]